MNRKIQENQPKTRENHKTEEAKGSTGMIRPDTPRFSLIPSLELQNSQETGISPKRCHSEIGHVYTTPGLGMSSLRGKDASRSLIMQKEGLKMSEIGKNGGKIFSSKLGEKARQHPFNTLNQLNRDKEGARDSEKYLKGEKIENFENREIGENKAKTPKTEPKSGTERFKRGGKKAQTTSAQKITGENRIKARNVKTMISPRQPKINPGIGFRGKTRPVGDLSNQMEPNLSTAMSPNEEKKKTNSDTKTAISEKDKEVIANFLAAALTINIRKEQDAEILRILDSSPESEVFEKKGSKRDKLKRRKKFLFSSQNGQRRATDHAKDNQNSKNPNFGDSEEDLEIGGQGACKSQEGCCQDQNQLQNNPRNGKERRMIKNDGQNLQKSCSMIQPNSIPKKPNHTKNRLLYHRERTTACKNTQISHRNSTLPALTQKEEMVKRRRRCACTALTSSGPEYSVNCLKCRGTRHKSSVYRSYFGYHNPSAFDLRSSSNMTNECLLCCLCSGGVICLGLACSCLCGTCSDGCAVNGCGETVGDSCESIMSCETCREACDCRYVRTCDCYNMCGISSRCLGCTGDRISGCCSAIGACICKILKCATC